MNSNDIKKWCDERIIREEIDKYRDNEQDFINDQKIEAILSSSKEPDSSQVNDILDKSLAIETLSMEETAMLLNVKDPDLWEKMAEIAGKIKRK